MRRLLFALLMAAVAFPATAAEGWVGPRLAVASNAGQGWLPDLMRAAVADGLTDFRDAVYWDRVERDGAYVFDTPTTTFPDRLGEWGAGLSLTVNNGHPAYDDGHTPHTPEAIGAFAAHAAATVLRFPAIHTVEVGNEWNAANFVSGPVLDDGLEGRARHHLAILEATHRAIKAVRPDVRVLGGAAHSIPGAYLSDLLSIGAREHMDALAIHPYTTPVEQIVRHIAFLRGLPGAEGLEIEVTEFSHAGGQEDAADHLLKSYCQLARAGVSRAVWYPLQPRGDGLAALYTRDGRRLASGDAHRLIRETLEGVPVVDAAPDPFTHACAFGRPEAPRHLVIWGAPRTVAVASEFVVRRATGEPVPAPHALSGAPLLISAPAGRHVRLGETVRLGSQRVIADSYAQYAFPREPGAQAPGDPFERFARVGDRRLALDTRPGQDRNGVPWFPYRGAAGDGGLWMTSETLVPSRWGDRPIEIVHRYVAPRAMAARLDVRLEVPARSDDGIRLRLVQADAVLADLVVTGERTVSLDLSLDEGAEVDVAVGPNGTPRGDAVGYRIRLIHP